jgi:geranylgeranyl transferase type-2 subunit beta
MSSFAYLDMLDDWLGRGIAGLSPRFVDAQLDFLAACQQTDGGFRGRQGGSDLYYTDFALRTLDWLAPGHAAFERGLRYMAHRTSPPLDTLECFHLLNARRLARRHSVATAHWTIDTSAFAAQLRARMLPAGGLARSPRDTTTSAYHTFIGALCFQMLDVEFPSAPNAVAAIEALRCPNGGYTESAGQTSPQTNATAAAVAMLLMHDALPPHAITPTAQFLASMQAADGGIRPHAAVAHGDLLSTFTGLLTLCALGELPRADTATAAQFLRATAHPNGGFLACPADDTPDLEYSYYGVATLALLRATTQSPGAETNSTAPP